MVWQPATELLQIAFIILGFFILFTSHNVVASDTDTFTQSYLKEEEKLFEQYVYNKKTVMTTTIYALDGEAQTPPVTSVRTTITSKDSARISNLSSTGSKLSHITTPTRAQFHDFDKLGFPHLGFDTLLSPQLWPCQINDSQVNWLLGNSIRLSNAKTDMTWTRIKIFNARSHNYHSHDAIAVDVQPNNVKRSTIYLDKNNHFAFLGYECQAAKKSGRLMYEQVPGRSYPMPKRFDQWKIGNDGKNVLQHTMEITEYSDYTPTADDFDFDKHGVTKYPPRYIYKKNAPQIPITEKSSRWGKWLYGSDIGFAILSVLMILYIRHARNKRVATRT